MCVCVNPFEKNKNKKVKRVILEVNVSVLSSRKINVYIVKKKKKKRLGVCVKSKNGSCISESSSKVNKQEVEHKINK